MGEDMGICPNCGSWVDEGDICMNCGGSGSYSSDNDDDWDSGYEPSYRPRKTPADRLGEEAWDLYMDFRDTEALSVINEALEYDDMHPNNWNRKAIILESLKRFGESERCYNRSLELRRSSKVSDNKARMLYDWACELLEKSKKMRNGLSKLGEASDTITRAIDALPERGSEEDIKKYLGLRDSINFNRDYQKKFFASVRIVGENDPERLFTITGTKHYGIKDFFPYTPLRLVREEDNEFDRDAIAVYMEDKKVGYVANNNSTAYEGTSLASQLKDKVQKEAKAEYLIYLDRYAEIQFHIGRLI